MIKNSWQVQEAKNKLSQVIEDAIHKGPQVITRHGTEVVVVLDYNEYRAMQASRPKLAEFFRNSPLANAEIDLERDTSAIREDEAL
jgi:prevent-host-death family protein